MWQTQQIEELVALVAALDRAALIRQFSNFTTTFPVDFSPAFLEEQSLDRLRHLLVALCLHTQKMPEQAAIGV
jgi:hypothetical protein